MSYIILHNGNKLIKPWASNFYSAESMYCLVDTWPVAANLHEKYNYASKHLICTDLTVTDKFDIKELYFAKNSFKIIKIITSYASDLENIEPCWTSGYEYNDWLESIFNRLSISDELIFWNQIKLPSTQESPTIIFTPGRSGTHLLGNITGVDNYIHHNGNILKTSKFARLINAEKILSILRSRFIDQAASDLIANTYNCMLTTADNLKSNQILVSNWSPIEFTRQHYQDTLEKISSYADLVLGLKMFYNKQIKFSILENLHSHFDKTVYIKNPYRAQDIISNYSQAVEICNAEYQPTYDQLISKLQSACGTNLYNI